MIWPLGMYPGWQMDPWRELDVSDWVVEHQEMRGKRAKFWVRDPHNTRWLRKEPRGSRPTEPAIEALVLRLARACGLSAPEGHACTWREADGTQRRGLVVRLFLEGEEELSLGSVELSSAPGDYDPERHELHTLPRVRAVLDALEAKYPNLPLLEPFVRMLAFDAWVGNGDRHQENWGVLRVGGEPKRLAPMFDPAACLGAELQDGHAMLSSTADLAGYIAGCPSGFGDDSKLVKHLRLVEELGAWPEWRAGISRWIDEFASTMDTFEKVVACVPEEWLSKERAAFACRLLRARLEWLSERCET